VVAAADFDGNGTPDLVWENVSSSQYAIGAVTVHYYSYSPSNGPVYTGWNWLNETPTSGWVVVGAADMNQKLSQSRAASVIAWLVSHGVPATRLKPQGFGATHPVADNSTEAGRALNRRVEMQLVQ